jgi:hypothetical protein
MDGRRRPQLDVARRARLLRYEAGCRREVARRVATEPASSRSELAAVTHVLEVGDFLG